MVSAVACGTQLTSTLCRYRWRSALRCCTYRAPSRSTVPQPEVSVSVGHGGVLGHLVCFSIQALLCPFAVGCAAQALVKEVIGTPVQARTHWFAELVVAPHARPPSCSNLEGAKALLEQSAEQSSMVCCQRRPACLLSSWKMSNRLDRFRISLSRTTEAERQCSCLSDELSRTRRLPLSVLFSQTYRASVRFGPMQEGVLFSDLTILPKQRLPTPHYHDATRLNKHGFTKIATTPAHTTDNSTTAHRINSPKVCGRSHHPPLESPCVRSSVRGLHRKLQTLSLIHI